MYSWYLEVLAYADGLTCSVFLEGVDVFIIILRC